MTGVLFGAAGRWARTDGRSVSRRQLIAEVLDNAEDLFPGLLLGHVELVKHYANDEFVTDLVFIDRHKRRWWVGLIATEVDDFEMDIVQPVRAIQRVKYIKEDRLAIADAELPIDADWLDALIADVQPEPVAFVGNPDPTWFEQLAKENGALAVLELFASEDATHLIRLNGQIPRARGVNVASCTKLPGAVPVLKLELEEGVLLPEVLHVVWNDGISIWRSKNLDEYTLLHTDITISVDDVPLRLWHLGHHHYVLRLTGVV